MQIMLHRLNRCRAKPQKCVPDVREMVSLATQSNFGRIWRGREGDRSEGYGTVRQGHDDWGYADCGDGRGILPWRAAWETLQSELEKARPLTQTGPQRAWMYQLIMY